MDSLLEIVINQPFQADQIQDLYSDKLDLTRANPKASYPFSASEWTSTIENDPENISLLFIHKKEILGHVALILNSERLYLCFVIVKNDYRRQGFGKNIIILAEEFVRLNYSNKLLHLNVDSQNSAALNLYKGLNYEVEAQSGDLITMVKDLTQKKRPPIKVAF